MVWLVALFAAILDVTLAWVGLVWVVDAAVSIQ